MFNPAYVLYGVVIFLVGSIVVFGWRTLKRERKLRRDIARREINNALNDIADNEMATAIVRSMFKNDGISKEEIIKITESKRKANKFIFELLDIGRTRRFPNPLFYQEGDKIFITPKWLDFFQKLDELDWDFDELDWDFDKI